MSDQFRRWRVFIVHPEDVADEVQHIVAAGNAVNSELQTLGYADSVVMIDWQMLPSGSNPGGTQAYIERAAKFEEADFIIGVFWKRFGTPFDQRDSFSSQEIRKALELARTRADSCPVVMAYEKTVPYLINSPEDAEQLLMLRRFIAELWKSATVRSFSTSSELQLLIRADIRSHIATARTREGPIRRNGTLVPVLYTCTAESRILRAEGLCEAIGPITIRLDGPTSESIRGEAVLYTSVPISSRLRSGQTRSVVSTAVAEVREVGQPSREIPLITSATNAMTTKPLQLTLPAELVFRGVRVSCYSDPKAESGISVVRAAILFVSDAVVAPREPEPSFEIGIGRPSTELNVATRQSHRTHGPSDIREVRLRFCSLFAGAFRDAIHENDGAGATSGTRFIAFFLGKPDGVTIWVPDRSDDEIGRARLVRGADANGAGGAPVERDGVPEWVELPRSGVVVWEYADSRPSVEQDGLEFLVRVQPFGEDVTGMMVAGSYAPISPNETPAVAGASTSLPIPRFVRTGSPQPLFTGVNRTSDHQM